jgi:ketosteroid isomerase-like protein
MDAAYRLKTDEEEVLGVNRAFFQALESLDVEQMEAVWWHEDWVQILHPGWELIVGWDEIRESWVDIFRSTVRMRVAISHPFVHVVGNAAWVSCRPEITYTSKEGFTTAAIDVLNIFVRRNGAWRIVHHHAALVPAQPVAEVVQ